MASHRLFKLEIDGMEIIGYSVAGEETVIGMPQLDVCFDIGKAPDQLIPINNVLLTHGHIDHAAGLAYYLSHRNFCGQKPGTVFAPENLIDPIKDIIKAWGKLDGNQIPAKIVGVKPGDECRIKPNLIAKVFPSRHSKGSVGYTIIEKRKKLRDEYIGLTGQQLVELKRKNVEIDRSIEIPIVTYLGDTKFVDFSSLDYVAKSKILIVECTFFIDDHIDRAQAGKHMHVDEFAQLIGKLQNEHVVVMHTTQRTGIGEIKKILQQKLTAEYLKKIVILMDRDNQ
ncbi:MAG: MBL fold metallo-hydrolase [Sedimentisphaerales bacterium]|nr:MBL fold metallo-hydrolase [Sedimentisphaerales bacterium]